MVTSIMPIKLAFSVIFFLTFFSAYALQQFDTILQSKTYSGRKVTESIEDFYKNTATSYGLDVSESNSPYQTVELPLLVGVPIDKIEPYVHTYGPPDDLSLSEDLLRLSPFQVENAHFGNTPAKEVSATEFLYYPSSKDYLKEVTSVGYYVHNGQLTTSNFIYHDAAIFKPQRTPYYKEIQQKFQKSKYLIFESKKSKVNQKHLDFYHFKRNDGYIESYGFYKIPPKYGMEAKVTLVFQALYPSSQKESLAKHATKLLKKHYHAVNQRYKKLSK